jgi:hypothetical protein
MRNPLNSIVAQNIEKNGLYKELKSIFNEYKKGMQNTERDLNFFKAHEAVLA